MEKKLRLVIALIFISPFFGKASITQYDYRFATVSHAIVLRGPLPVVLVDFVVAPDADKTVNIKWSTQQETNSSQFVIERSTDGVSWLSIGTIAAKGYSTQVSNYSFKDLSSLNGITYYRLRVENKDGDFGYTQIQIARVSLAEKFTLFPDPANDYVYISTRASIQVALIIRLVSPGGQVLQEKKINAGKGETVSLPVQIYPAGIYIVEISGSDGTKQTSKLLVAH